MTDIQTIQTFLETQGIELAIKIAGAVAAWIVGRKLISFGVGLLGRAMGRSDKIDAGVAKYLGTIVSIVLTLFLVLAVLGMFGIETTSFVAIFAGLGLAVGTAWGGILTNFAAGLFLQVLRPFKVGDVISSGAISGTVSEIGLFYTRMLAGDNTQVIVGNNTLFSGTIQNFSATPYRRVDCQAKVANEVDVHEAIASLRAAVVAIPNVLETPPPDIEILSFTPEGPMLAVRPYTANENYWQVFFDTNRAIVDAFTGAGYPVPHTPVSYAAPPVANGSAPSRPAAQKP